MNEGQPDEVVYRGSPLIASGYKAVGSDPASRAKVFKFKDIGDGLSHTLLVAEVRQGKQSTTNLDLRGFIWWGYASGFMTFLPPNSSQPDVLHADYYCNNDPSVNPPCIGPHTTERPLTMGARSRHPGGIQAALCDGSTRFISDNIELRTWRGLGTTQGKEVLGQF